MSGQTVGQIGATALLAYGLMAVIAMSTAGFIAALVKALAAIGRRHRAAAPAPVAAVVPAPVKAAPAPATFPGIEPEVAAAISAAIHSIIGPHAVVYIGVHHEPGGWTGEARLFHHGSHHPHSP